MRSLVALTAVLVLAGCATDYTCTEWCEASAECEGTATDACADTCTQVEALNSDAGCGVMFDLMLSCLEGEQDVCSDSSSCTEQSGTWVGCVLVYCDGHSTDERCASISAG